jgi:AcrR family transcriptional regulator
MPSGDEREPSAPARFGRPPKVDTNGTPTRERLLDAAVEVCVEYGYDAATLTEIARRADVSTPAIYNHFVDKPDLMVAASRRELDRIRWNNFSSDRLVHATVDQWLDPANATMLSLLVELHMAAARHMATTAEGVETEAQRAVLLQLGCSQMQGWLFSPAVPAAKLKQLLLAQAAAA